MKKEGTKARRYLATVMIVGMVLNPTTVWANSHGNSDDTMIVSETKIATMSNSMRSTASDIQPVQEEEIIPANLTEDSQKQIDEETEKKKTIFSPVIIVGLKRTLKEHIATDSNATEELATETNAIELSTLSNADKYSGISEYLCAQVGEAEAGGSGDIYEMMYPIGVALNRVKDCTHFGSVNTLEEVLAQPGQYPTTWKKIKRGIKPSPLALEAARRVLSGEDIYYTVGDQKFLFGEDILYQTGKPLRNTKVVFKSKLHYFAKAR